MFKENRSFWFYIIGIIFLMVLLYFVMVSYQFPFVGFLSGKKDEKAFKYDSVPEMQLNDRKDYRAKVHTNKGTFEIDLYEDNAPQTVNSFVFLGNEGYFDKVEFHRIIKDFLLQTGSRNTLNDDPDDDALGYPGYYFDDEINWSSLGLSADEQKDLAAGGYSNDTGVKSRRLEKYSVAMANAGPDTNGSQFFIMLADSSDSRVQKLQGRHTVFGAVVSGFDVLEKINQASIENAENDALSRPIGDYYITSIEIVAL